MESPIASLDDLSRKIADKWLFALAVWIALSLLLAATVAGAYLPIGHWKLVLAIAIAVAKAALVVLFFMEITKAGSLVRLSALAGVLWLIVFFALTFADVATRATLD